jgi:hypothetical protein
MNSDVVCGGSVAAGFGANGFQDEPPLGVTGFLATLPRNGLPLSTGFGAGVKTCFVFDHIVAGAEPILLSIEGWAGGGEGGRIGLPLSCGTVVPKLELEFGFFGGGGGSCFAANGFKLLHVHPSPRAV